MANGRVFHAQRLSAASAKLPIGVWVRVRHHANHRSVLVQIEDRGPYRTGRGLDLSEAAARRLGMIREGVAAVSIEVIRRPACRKRPH